MLLYHVEFMLLEERVIRYLIGNIAFPVFPLAKGFNVCCDLCPLQICEITWREGSNQLIGVIKLTKRMLESCFFLYPLKRHKDDHHAFPVSTSHLSRYLGYCLSLKQLLTQIANIST
jgi:hypothetical protein